MGKINIFSFIYKRFFFVILFSLLSFSVYQYAVKPQNNDIQNYRLKLQNIQNELSLSNLENEDIKIMVNSLSDHEWIEMILMRDLGVVPEGKLKVYFKSSD